MLHIVSVLCNFVSKGCSKHLSQVKEARRQRERVIAASHPFVRTGWGDICEAASSFTGFPCCSDNFYQPKKGCAGRVCGKRIQCNQQMINNATRFKAFRRLKQKHLPAAVRACFHQSHWPMQSFPWRPGVCIQSFDWINCLGSMEDVVFSWTSEPLNLPVELCCQESISAFRRFS